jgi:hypothetical protein
MVDLPHCALFFLNPFLSCIVYGTLFCAMEHFSAHFTAHFFLRNGALFGTLYGKKAKMSAEEMVPKGVQILCVCVLYFWDALFCVF